MLRKQIIKVPTTSPALMEGQIDVAAVATVLVTSEDPDHPVDHAFDSHSGPGPRSESRARSISDWGIGRGHCARRPGALKAGHTYGDTSATSHGKHQFPRVVPSVLAQ